MKFGNKINTIKGKKGYQKKDPDEVRKYSLYFRITLEEKIQLNEYCKERDLNKSDFVRGLIKQAIDNSL